MEQQKSPLESIPKIKLFADMQNEKGTDQIPLVSTYVFIKSLPCKKPPSRTKMG